MNDSRLYLTLAIACIVGAVTVALAGSGNADDLLAVALVGLAGTLAGRGKGAA
jgi:hypothetical protein